MEVSHRAKALQALREYLENQGTMLP